MSSALGLGLRGVYVNSSIVEVHENDYFLLLTLKNSIKDLQIYLVESNTIYCI